MDLSKFCATTIDPRTHMRQPALVPEGVLATNGHILIIVNGMTGDYPPAEMRISSQLPKFTNAPRHAAWYRVADIDLGEAIACKHCAGAGHRFVIGCPSCNARGWFVYHDQEYDCRNCGGGGQCFCEPDTPQATQQTCWDCEGFGTEFQPIAVGSAHLQRKYLALLAELPGCMLQTGDKETVSAFTFDGGHGFLMPCNQRDEATTQPI